MVLPLLASLAAQRASMSTLSRVAGYAALAGAGVAFAGLAGGNLVGSNPFNNARLTFPDDLETNDHWISFEAVQTQGQASNILSSFNLGNLSGKFTTGGGMAFLPMPSNVSTDYNPEYTSKELGPMAGQALKPFDRAIYGNNELSQGALNGGSLTGLFTSTAAGAGLQAAQKAVGAAGGGDAFDALLKVSAGLAVNPHKILLFTGVNFRDHSFSWKLSPKNRYESDIINSIIQFFTFHSHPEYISGGLFFKYPEFFKIKFHYPQYLFEIRPSVCTDIRVNYHGQGYPAYIRNADGGGIPAPAEVELTLSFKETEIVTKDSLNPPRIIMQPAQRSPQQSQSNGPVQNTTNGPTFSPGA